MGAHRKSSLSLLLLFFPGYDKELAAGEPSAFKGRTLHVRILLLFKELRLEMLSRDPPSVGLKG